MGGEAAAGARGDHDADQGAHAAEGGADGQEERGVAGEDEEHREPRGGRPLAQEAAQGGRGCVRLRSLWVCTCVVLTSGAEDMFGADDADWAIYRKIVSSLLSRSRLSSVG